MPVSIRLSRFGRKDLPFYRVVVVDSRKKRDGEFLENIGTYDGLKTKLVTFKPERYDAWVKLGAQPSDTAKKLYRLFKKEGVKVAKSEEKSVKAAVSEKTKKPTQKVATAKTESSKPEANKVAKEAVSIKVAEKTETKEEASPKEEPKE